MLNIKKYARKIITRLRLISIRLRGNNFEKFYKDKIIKYYSGANNKLSTEQSKIIEYLKKNSTNFSLNDSKCQSFCYRRFTNTRFSY